MEIVGDFYYVALLHFVTFMNMLFAPLGPVSNPVAVITVGLNLPAVRPAIFLTDSAAWRPPLTPHKNYACIALHQLHGYIFLICFSDAAAAFPKYCQV